MDRLELAAEIHGLQSALDRIEDRAQEEEIREAALEIFELAERVESLRNLAQ